MATPVGSGLATPRGQLLCGVDGAYRNLSRCSTTIKVLSREEWETRTWNKGSAWYVAEFVSFFGGRRMYVLQESMVAVDEAGAVLLETGN